MPLFLSAEPPGKTKNTGVGCLSLLQWICLTQETTWGLLHCQRILPAEPPGKSTYSFSLAFWRFFFFWPHQIACDILILMPSAVRARSPDNLHFCTLKQMYFLKIFTYFLTALGLHCCLWGFSSCSKQGLLLIGVHRILTGGFSCCGAQILRAQIQ